jgi:hypothetical protein
MSRLSKWGDDGPTQTNKQTNKQANKQTSKQSNNNNIVTVTSYTSILFVWLSMIHKNYHNHAIGGGYNMDVDVDNLNQPSTTTATTTATAVSSRYTSYLEVDTIDDNVDEEQRHLSYNHYRHSTITTTTTTTTTTIPTNPLTRLLTLLLIILGMFLSTSFVYNLIKVTIVQRETKRPWYMAGIVLQPEAQEHLYNSNNTNNNDNDNNRKNVY